MKAKSKQSGLTLIEMTVVITIVAVFTIFGLPALRAFFNSFEFQGGAKAMISAAPSSARAIAAKEQHYAGIRFQKAYNPESPLKASQYMIFIVHDQQATDLANGFRAVEALEPIKLPDSVGVMEFVNENTDIDDNDKLVDKTAFSIIFSPSGKLVIHDVQVRNKDGVPKPASPAQSKDDIFNSELNIANYSTGMFVQDDYEHRGLYKEPSRNSFIIYDRVKFKEVYEKDRRAFGHFKEFGNHTYKSVHGDDDKKVKSVGYGKITR